MGRRAFRGSPSQKVKLRQYPKALILDSGPRGLYLSRSGLDRAIQHGSTPKMRAEPLALVEQIKQSVGLLRRHL